MRYFILLCFAIFLYRFHLPSTLKPHEALLEGTIASIPEWHHRSWQFIFATDHPKARMMVDWFSPPPVTLRVGDRWELDLRMTPSNNNWLYTQHINAIATVQINFKNQLLEKHHWKFPISHIRQEIYNHIQNTLAQYSDAGFIGALSIGMRDKITEPQWQDLRGTGTNHLMAIAGLHIGFVAMMAYTMVNFCWRRSIRLLLYIPAQEAATIGALIAAFLYSALAGFALPTQRAIIMLSVFLMTKLLRRNSGLWNSWIIALGIILAYEPLSVLESSFWLSFTAVALLIYGNSARLNENSVWWHWGRAQWVMAIGLTPLSLLFFQQVSLTSFIANFVAIPFIGFIILPLCVLGDITTLGFFWKLAAILLMHFWPLIHWLAQFPHSQWITSMPHYWMIFTTFVAVLLFLAPRGLPARWLGILWLLPVIMRH